MTVNWTERTEGSPKLMALRVRLPGIKGRREVSQARAIGRTDGRSGVRAPISFPTHEDAHEPGPDRGRPCGPKVLPGSAQDLADLDFGQGLASGHQGGRAKEHVLVKIHQMAEGLRVAVLGALQRLGLGHSSPRFRCGMKGLHG